MACAVAIESLKVLKEENMAENAETMGKLFRNELQKLNSPYISIIRGKGLLNAIVINHANKDAAWELCLELKENGLLAKPTHGDKIRFAPPLIITQKQIMECVEIIDESLKELGEGVSRKLKFYLLAPCLNFQLNNQHKSSCNN